MSETQATHDEVTNPNVSVYMSGFPHADEETDTESERFQVARDIRGFGTEAFDAFDVDPDHAADVAYAPLVEDAAFDGTFENDEEVVARVFRAVQGGTRVPELGYDGSKTRSMMMGDVVVVNGTAYMVDSYELTKVDMSFD